MATPVAEHFLHARCCFRGVTQMLSLVLRTSPRRLCAASRFTAGSPEACRAGHLPAVTWLGVTRVPPALPGCPSESHLQRLALRCRAEGADSQSPGAMVAFASHSQGAVCLPGHCSRQRDVGAGNCCRQDGASVGSRAPRFSARWGAAPRHVVLVPSLGPGAGVCQVQGQLCTPSGGRGGRGSEAAPPRRRVDAGASAPCAHAVVSRLLRPGDTSMTPLPTAPRAAQRGGGGVERPSEESPARLREPTDTWLFPECTCPAPLGGGLRRPGRGSEDSSVPTAALRDGDRVVLVQSWGCDLCVGL